MKSQIVFRATFEQPIGALNPNGWKMPGPVWVEIYQDRVKPSEWKARRPDTNSEFKITRQSTWSGLQSQMEFFFKRQLTEWQALYTGESPARELSKVDWYCDSAGRPLITDAYRESLKDRKNVVTK